ncbi:MAG: PAN domain-containing protein [Pseudomonadota bacterium]
MRVLPVILAAMVFTGPASAEKAEPKVNIAYETNTYRFGEILRSERGTTIEDCAMMCSQDRACMSWTLVPATFRMGPRCELKTSPGVASHRPGAASGMSEMWQMDAGRHAEMRYQPRAFGEPLPEREPELMGAPTAPTSAEIQTPAPAAPAPVQARVAPANRVDTPPPAAPIIMAAPARPTPPPAAPAPIQTAAVPVAPTPIAKPDVISIETAAPKPLSEVVVARGPAAGATPRYVKQPAPAPESAPAEPHPLYRAPKRVAAPTNSKLVFKDPSRDQVAPDQPVADYNAVLKRESQSAPTPQTVSTPAEPVRLPWTERDTAAPDYSVGGGEFIPGDEDASAGLVDERVEVGS